MVEEVIPGSDAGSRHRSECCLQLRRFVAHPSGMVLSVLVLFRTEASPYHLAADLASVRLGQSSSAAHHRGILAAALDRFHQVLVRMVAAGRRAGRRRK